MVSLGGRGSRGGGGGKSPQRDTSAEDRTDVPTTSSSSTSDEEMESDSLEQAAAELGVASPVGGRDGEGSSSEASPEKGTTVPGESLEALELCEKLLP